MAAGSRSQRLYAIPARHPDWCTVDRSGSAGSSTGLYRRQRTCCLKYFCTFYILTDHDLSVFPFGAIFDIVRAYGQVSFQSLGRKCLKGHPSISYRDEGRNV